jgi:undecaprenyl-diphosphatase
MVMPRQREKWSTPIVMIGCAFAAFILLTILVTAHAGTLLRADAAVSSAAWRFAVVHPVWLDVMRAVTTTGSTVVLWPATAILCGVLLVRRRPRQAGFVAAGMVVTLAVRLLLVTLIARPRPADRLAAAHGWSFPSGHTTASATFAMILALICRRLWISVLATAWAVTVGLSRVALVVHWPSDVLGGWLLVLTLVPTIHGVVFARWRPR